MSLFFLENVACPYQNQIWVDLPWMVAWEEGMGSLVPPPTIIGSAPPSLSP